MKKLLLLAWIVWFQKDFHGWHWIAKSGEYEFGEYSLSVPIYLECEKDHKTRKDAVKCVNIKMKRNGEKWKVGKW